VTDSPAIVDEVVGAMLEGTPSMRMFVKRGKTPLENYQAGGALRALISTRIKEKHPDRYEDIDSHYQKRITEVDEEIAALDPD
jgi:hypothetical protein